MSWEEDQNWEASWWGDCSNTFGEESKQITYAHRMGLENTPVDGHWPVYNIGGKSILDIGGGPTSLLLKTINRGRRVVIDPAEYPDWVGKRYRYTDIEFYRYTGEEYPKFSAWQGEISSPLSEVHFDECWIYNVLQHVIDPDAIIANARASADAIRIFEWIDMPPSVGHPHTLQEEELNAWLDSEGTTEEMTGENDCWGKAYYGYFKYA